MRMNTLIELPKEHNKKSFKAIKGRLYSELVDACKAIETYPYFIVNKDDLLKEIEKGKNAVKELKKPTDFERFEIINDVIQNLKEFGDKNINDDLIIGVTVPLLRALELHTIFTKENYLNNKLIIVVTQEEKEMLPSTGLEIRLRDPLTESVLVHAQTILKDGQFLIDALRDELEESVYAVLNIQTQATKLRTEGKELGSAEGLALFRHLFKITFIIPLGYSKGMDWKEFYNKVYPRVYRLERKLSTLKEGETPNLVNITGITMERDDLKDLERTRKPKEDVFTEQSAHIITRLIERELSSPLTDSEYASRLQTALTELQEFK